MNNMLGVGLLLGPAMGTALLRVSTLCHMLSTGDYTVKQLPHELQYIQSKEKVC